MTFYSRLAFKIVATVISAFVAFAVGFVATGAYYDRYVLPGLLKLYPHDGQLGLEEFVHSINGGAVAATAIVILGVIWIAATTRRSA